MTLAEEQPVASRFDTIDLMRGFSILNVVLLHASLWLSFSEYEVGRSFPKWLRFVVFSGGGSGVSAFFAISGFLITFISIRRFGSLGRIKLTAFCRLRFARIAPLLGLLLLVLSVLHVAHFADFRIRASTSLPQALFAAATFQVNWFEAVHGWLPASWTVLWSLSVEEMFYLFFPLVCIVCLRSRAGWPAFVALLLGLILFAPVARSPWYAKNEIWAYQSYLGNMDNVALGCLTAVLTERLARTRFVRSKWPSMLQLLGTMLSLFVVLEWPKTIFGWHIFRFFARSATDTTVLGVGVCLIMLGSVLRRKQGSRWTMPVRWLGRYSYEIYLTHEFVVIGILNWFLRTRREPVALWILSVVTLSGALGYVLARFVSEPLNRRLRGAVAYDEGLAGSKHVLAGAAIAGEHPEIA